MWKKILWSLRIRRVEYRVAELPLFLIPIFLVASNYSVFGSLVFVESLVIFLLLFSFGDLLNCLADRDLDAIYKPHLTEAVDGLGERGVWNQAIASGIAAVVLALHLAIAFGLWLLVPMVCVGLLLAYAYSVEPIRLKGRGIWQLLFYWLGLFSAPMGMSIYIFSPEVNWPAIAVALAYGLMQTGVILVNTAEDYPEDRAMAVRTIVVAWGMEKSVILSFLMTMVGGLCLGSLLFWLWKEASGSGAYWSCLIPFAASLMFAISRIGWLACAVLGRSEGEALNAIRKGAKWVPLWITSLAISTLLAAIGIFCERLWI